MELPKPYVDVVVKNKEGLQRIARLTHDKKHFALCSYGAKYQYLWKVEEVVAWKVVEYFQC